MVNDYFIGSEMGVENADKFTTANITPEMIEEDVALMDTKYWDYKFWHPAVATMYFAARYHALATNIIRREVGVAESEQYAKRTKYFDLRKQSLRTIRGMWRARQTADAIGCTYDVFIRASIGSFRDNYHKIITTKKVGKNGKRQILPMPNQLYNQFVRERAILDWTKDKIVRFPMPKHELIPHNTELWFRPEMESWLREEAGKIKAGKSYIADAIAAGIILESA